MKPFGRPHERKKRERWRWEAQQRGGRAPRLVDVL
jgi:hypothetical protein